MTILRIVERIRKIADLQLMFEKSRILFVFLLLFTIPGMLQSRASASDDPDEEGSSYLHQVFPGDSWTALAWRFTTTPQDLRDSNGFINQDVQPAIGSVLTIPSDSGHLNERSGRLISTDSGGLVQIALLHNSNPWLITLLNGLQNPFRPTLFRPLYFPEPNHVPRELPVGFDSLEVSSIPATPGQALALRGVRNDQGTINATLSDKPFVLALNGSHFIGLIGVGAFVEPGLYELSFNIEGYPPWSQPLLFQPGQWTYDQVTLTGSAAAIDSESIQLERERLTNIWSQVNPEPMWKSNFQTPIDQFLEVSSLYGARRSYNGGPYDSYHEGVDFSAYAGTAVYAPAKGRIVLAEQLYVRGGSVMIDHGLGIYTGLYHLSEVLVQAGQLIDQGEIVGRVGSTGLSTGNHLHWDQLVAGEWVDASVWRDSGMGCWILEGWGKPCNAKANE